MALAWRQHYSSPFLLCWYHLTFLPNTWTLGFCVGLFILKEDEKQAPHPHSTTLAYMHTHTHTHTPSTCMYESVRTFQVAI